MTIQEPRRDRPSRTAAAAPDLGSARILIADSESGERELLVSILEQRGYAIVDVSRAEDVPAALMDHAIDVIIVDGDLAGGAAGVITAIRGERLYADVPIILVGPAVDAVEDAVLSGVDATSTKPIDPQVLVELIRDGLRTRRSLLGMEAAHAVVASLANELLAPETDVRLHTERLGVYASQLGRRVGLSASELAAIAHGTLLHDLAKLGIAEWILLKPGPFTEEERVAMQRHTEIGERIAATLPGADRFAPILRHHHERWDGAGYPDGLAGDAIPIGARIIGVVDAFDAMTQYRNYRKALSVPDALDELKRERSGQFDPDLVDAFIEVLRWDGLI